MEITKENNQVCICGYCSNKIAENDNYFLTITDKDGKIMDKINICGGCSKRLHLKLALSKMPKEDIESLDQFLRRKKK